MAVCLVTGGAGFIGSHIAGLLAASGHDARVFDKASPKAAFPAGIRFIRGDITECDAIASAMEGVDFVFHQAALVSVAESMRDPEMTMRINVGGTRNVLDAALAAGAEKAILASSAAVYGDSPPPLRESSPLSPISPYGASKLECERLAAAYQRKGLKTVSLRYFNVYGPRQDPSSPYSGVVARFIGLAMMGRPPTIFGDGSQSRDFVFVRDVARANMLAMGSGASGEFNIAGGTPVTVLALYDEIKRLAGSDAGPVFAPAREGDIRHSYADISKAEKALGFRPRTTLREGLRETLSWARSVS